MKACIYRALVCCAAFLVPRSERKEWLAEWRSELWYLLNTRDSDQPLRFCLGSFKDAAWQRRNHVNPNSGELLWFRSPLQCITFLTILAVITIAAALRSLNAQEQFIWAYLTNLGMALLILPATTTMTLGEYPPALHSPSSKARLRRWIFLGLKFALILPIVLCGTLDVGPIVASPGLRPLVTLIAYILAFRWALIDQRRRCPVCLRLLTSPVRIGQPSHTVLDWYGTELVCSKGHGMLHVAETPTSSYAMQRWLHLDSSWQSLFS
jgi:hypothetical protein